MRDAGARAIEDLEGVGSYEEKAVAAYKTMAAILASYQMCPVSDELDNPRS